jgi:hypothetical protein
LGVLAPFIGCAAHPLGLFTSAEGSGASFMEYERRYFGAIAIFLQKARIAPCFSRLLPLSLARRTAFWKLK